MLPVRVIGPRRCFSPLECSPGTRPRYAIKARGDWNRAHEIAQSQKGRSAAAVHAYLHRKEGDLPNADYWYERAGRARTRGALEKEWESLVTELLGT